MLIKQTNEKFEKPHRNIAVKFTVTTTTTTTTIAKANRH